MLVIYIFKMKAFLKKLIVHFAKIISFIFYKKFGNEIIKYWGFQGAYWIVNSLWFQKILGFNRGAPYPMHFTTRISDYNNLTIPVSSMNNLQSPGAYYQNFSGKIILGEKVFIAPNVGLITSNHKIDNLSEHIPSKDIIISDNCWIGMNSVIMPGIYLAEKTIVGAGSVVTKSFSDGGIVIAGCPAKIIKQIKSKHE